MPPSPISYIIISISYAEPLRRDFLVLLLGYGDRSLSSTAHVVRNTPRSIFPAHIQMNYHFLN